MENEGLDQARKPAENFCGVLVDPRATNTGYHRIAARAWNGCQHSSDGGFAVSHTLPLLDLRVPVEQAIQRARPVAHAGRTCSAAADVHMMSFMTLGIFWLGQQTQL